ncbi:MAG: hypothetical protein OXQ31_13970 [Spirochaetaceae bacterium]|nr:hypothetical protein [Spirochaetaceae bacterium]
MFKKISLLAVTAAAVALALTSCVKAPVSGLLDTKGLDGSWRFGPSLTIPVALEAEVKGTSVTVTIGTGMAPISMHEDLAAVTKLVVVGTLTEDAEENTFTLMLAEGDSIMAMVAVPDAFKHATETVAEAAVKTMVEAAQKGTVMITLNSDEDPDTLVVQGSFIEALLTASGLPPAPMGLMATRIIE